MAEGLGVARLPEALKPARPPLRDLAPSTALSIQLNGPSSFAGRKLGILVSDGTDARLLGALRQEAGEQGVTVNIVAPTVGGVELSDGKRVPADQKVDGGPSVLYDAVAVLVSVAGARAAIAAGRFAEYAAATKQQWQAKSDVPEPYARR